MYVYTIGTVEKAHLISYSVHYAFKRDYYPELCFQLCTYYERN